MRKTRALLFIPFGLILGFAYGTISDNVLLFSSLGLITGVLSTVERQGLKLKK